MSDVYRDNSVTKFEYSPATLRSLYSMFLYGESHGGARADALWYFSTRVSYGELHEMIDAFAAGLVRLGVKKGDFVTIFLPNIPQCVVAVYAINRIGAVCNLVHPLSTKSELEYCLKLTGSKVILTFEGNEGMCSAFPVKIIRCLTPTFFPKNPKGLVMKLAFNYSMRHSPRAADATLWTDVLADGRAFLNGGGALPEDTVKTEDPAAIMYTGGTTGDPKGVVLSNAAVNASTSEMILEKLDNAPHIGYAFLSVLPVFHAFGLSIVIHAPLSGGMRAVLLPRFSVKECARVILKEKIEILAGVPAMFDRMYPILSKADMSFVKHMVSGGDKVSPELIDRYNAILKGTQFLPGYGLTEACGACLLTKPGYAVFPEGCVGKPLRKNTVCLVAPGTTDVVPDTEEGELCIRGPMLMSGYYKNDEATAAVMRRHADGLVWLHTGDIVTIDAEGNSIFKSRYKRMIKVNGYNVYPTVIENAMEKCPAVREVCAVGMPWRTDMRIKLYVTLENPAEDREKAEEEIMAFAREHLNQWSCPKAVEFLDAMPMTKFSKMDYKVLEKRQ
ncbi:MAG: class I adenylate-forming enzyme family protein [Methanocorpusculum sp.]|nr:class I adenylate-forming enzyme family protein [Methanocorpusculum sp.]